MPMQDIEDMKRTIPLSVKGLNRIFDFLEQKDLKFSMAESKGSPFLTIITITSPSEHSLRFESRGPDPLAKNPDTFYSIKLDDELMGRTYFKTEPGIKPELTLAQNSIVSLFNKVRDLAETPTSRSIKLPQNLSEIMLQILDHDDVKVVFVSNANNIEPDRYEVRGKDNEVLFEYVTNGNRSKSPLHQIFVNGKLVAQTKSLELDADDTDKNALQVITKLKNKFEKAQKRREEFTERLNQINDSQDIPLPAYIRNILVAVLDNPNTKITSSNPLRDDSEEGEYKVRTANGDLLCTLKASEKCIQLLAPDDSVIAQCYPIISRVHDRMFIPDEYLEEIMTRIYVKYEKQPNFENINKNSFVR